MAHSIMPIYHGKRNFLGRKDLVVAFYTENCPFACTFCDLPYRSSSKPIDSVAVNEQISWLLEQYEEELGTFRILSVGNEGSILDWHRFPRSSFSALMAFARRMPLETLSLETRPEYATIARLREVMAETDAAVDCTIGFETQDDCLRNEVLGKRMRRDLFEHRVAGFGELGVSLTSYVMLKPGPTMTEADGVEEALATADYLHRLCESLGTQLTIYLNPTYVMDKAPLKREMIAAGYSPPTIESAHAVVTQIALRGIPVYTGLWSEGIATRDYRDAEFSPQLRAAIKRFNRTQSLDDLILLPEASSSSGD